MKKKFIQKAQKSSTQDEVEFISCHIITVRSNHKVEHKWKRTNFFQITKAKRHRSCPTRPVQFSLVALKPAVSGRNALSPLNMKSFSGRRKVTGERRKFFVFTFSAADAKLLCKHTKLFLAGYASGVTLRHSQQSVSRCVLKQNLACLVARTEVEINAESTVPRKKVSLKKNTLTLQHRKKSPKIGV